MIQNDVDYFDTLKLFSVEINPLLKYLSWYDIRVILVIFDHIGCDIFPKPSETVLFRLHNE
jgi:hypothetical protein